MPRIFAPVLGSVAVLATAGLLTACGDNESTASQTPSLSSSATAPSAAPEPESPPPGPPPAQDEAEQPVPETSEQPEQPEPEVQAPVTDEGPGAAFLGALAEQGLTPEDPDTAVMAANYVCQAQAGGAPDDQVRAYVAAMAGTDPAFEASGKSVEDAATIYIDAANQTYCA